MLASLIIWIYILIFAYIYGWTILEILLRLFHTEQDFSAVSHPIVALAGLCGITVFAEALSLFINLSWLAQTIFLVLGLFLAWRMWKKHVRIPSIRLGTIPWLLVLLFVLVFITVLENGTHGPSNPDTGIYQAQAIRWIETYPAVPGLGDFQSRLAYNSAWLVVNAFFSFSFLGLRSFHVLPGAFLLIALIYFLAGARNLIGGYISIADIFKMLVIPLVFYTIGSQISSPGTDFPGDVLIWTIFPLWLESLETSKDGQSGAISIKEILVFIFSVYLITIKLSMVPMLLLATYILIKLFFKDKLASAKLLVLSIIILAPWFARNLILSGYWLFPLPSIASLSPNWDWKMPLENVIQEQRNILAWARIPRVDAGQVLAMPLKNWLKVWFENLTLNRKLLVMGALFSPFLYAISNWVGLRKKTAFASYTLTYGISYMGFVFWLVEAPDIRFGYGVLISTLLLAGIPFLSRFLDQASLQKMITYALIILIVIYQGSVLYQSFDPKTISSRLFIPADYNGFATQPCQIHNETIFCAEYYNDCGYGSFPCEPSTKGNPLVEMRGPSLRDGYRFITSP